MLARPHAEKPPFAYGLVPPNELTASSPFPNVFSSFSVIEVDRLDDWVLPELMVVRVASLLIVDIDGLGLIVRVDV